MHVSAEDAIATSASSRYPDDVAIASQHCEAVKARHHIKTSHFRCYGGFVTGRLFANRQLNQRYLSIDDDVEAIGDGKIIAPAIRRAGDDEISQ